jgi:serine/threonine protein kinase
MFTMVVGRPPFESKTNEETYQKIKDVSYSFPSASSRTQLLLEPLSPTFEDLLTLILQRDPFMRPTLA